MVNHEERAYRAWPILSNCAANNDEITYGELANLLHQHHRPIRYVLEVIQAYCLKVGLPPLTILVINDGTKLPGAGFIAWQMDDLDRGRKEVTAYPWSTLENPFMYAADGTSEDDLAKTLVRDPASAAEVFARVKVRGMAQSIFRKTLLDVYGCRCAFCGLTFEDALEAAHLIGWAIASPQERLDVRNGVLLCSTHHKLFDAGLITLTNSGLVAYRETASKRGQYSSIDKSLTVSLHGKPALLPRTELHRPSATAISRSHKLHEWTGL
jgi:putative restriction endonuclease